MFPEIALRKNNNREHRIRDKVTLIGFGTFSVQHVSERTARNPQTGKPVQVKPKKKVRFKAGSEL